MKTSILVRISFFTALTAVLSQLSIPIGPVPISLGTLAVYLSAVFLRPKDAFISQIVYLCIGLIGVPVFSNFGGGASYLLGYTGGFAISYPIVAFCASTFVVLARENTRSKYPILIFGFILATMICYSLGIVWFCYVASSSITSAIPIVILPFIPGDIIKIGIACYIANVKHLKYNYI